MNVSVKLSRLISDDFASTYEELLKSKVSIKGAVQVARQYKQISKAVKDYASACENLISKDAVEVNDSLNQLLNSDIEITPINSEDISDVKISTEQYLLIADLIKNDI
jgi:hypothetical protein